MKRAPIIHGFILPGLLAVGALRAPVAASDGHVRTHAWSMEHGNLVSNWSFENELENWSFGSTSGVSTEPRFAPAGFSAPSGRFVGRVLGTSSSWWSAHLTTEAFPVMPGETYTLSFQVRASDSVSSDIHPALMLQGDDGSVLMVPGAAYATLAGGVIPEWTLYVRSFTLPSSGYRYHAARVALWRSAAPGATADLFFDDVVLEEGAVDAGTVAARRSRHGHAIGFSDALGKVHRNLIRLDDDGATWRVDGTDFDSAGRPVRNVLPVVAGMDYDPFLSANAGAYYHYAPGVPDAGGCPFAETEYAAEPGGRITRAAAPGGAWCLDGGHAVSRGSRYVSTLDPPPGDGTAAPPDPHERPWRLDWIRDEDSSVSLTWTDARGRIVQSAVRTESGWAVARAEFDPAGNPRRALTPIDVAGGGDAFAETALRDARGLTSARYTRDRGLELLRYNRAGLLRLKQDDRQRAASPPRATFFEYDRRGRLIATGEKDAPAVLPAYEDGFGRPDGESGRVEGRGFLYGSAKTFAERTGVPLDTVLYPLSSAVLPVHEGALVAAWNANPWSPAPGFSAAERLVADLFAYDDAGRVSIHYKYLGAVKTRVRRLQVTAFSYDTAGRVTERRSYDGAGYPDVPLVVQGWGYDALGRIDAVTVGGDTVARYAYAPHGVLDSVLLGTPGSGVTVAYETHIRGWTRSIAARRAGGGTLWRQAIGYETRALEGAGVPALTKPRHDGAPAQQVYAYGGGIDGPVRAVNYGYDARGRLVSADARQGTGASGTHELLFPLALADTDSLDAYVAFDDNGRIVGKRAGGSASADSAVYAYAPGSYAPDHVTGRLAADGMRDASAPGSFRYDVAGNLIEDASRGLVIDQAPDGMPVRFALRATAGTDSGAVLLYPFYDAAGRRVSQVAGSGVATGFPVYRVGTPQAGEAPGFYHAPDLAVARERAIGDANAHPRPDSVTFIVVAPAGDSAVEGASMLPLVLGGDTVRVVVRGVRKFGPGYDAYDGGGAGHLVRARHVTGATETEETYAPDGSVAGFRTSVVLEGRGVPIGRLAPVDTGTVMQFYVKNHLGSTVMVVNAEGGAPPHAFDYLPHGAMRSLRDDSLNPVGPTYTGKEHDTETGLHYFGARWYDPDLGMWLSPDPAGQFANPYLYAAGSPLFFYDPDGLWSLGLGVVFGKDGRGWHVGFGFAADFREETGVGVNTSKVWHEDGTNTTTVGGVVALPVADGIMVYNGASYSYNSRDGHNAGAVAGVADSKGVWGAEIGTNHSWDRGGRYRGGNAYAQAYSGYGGGVRGTAGYAVGWGDYESGPYARLGAAGFSWSADKNGLHYEGFSEDVVAGYRSGGEGKDKGFYIDYPGKDVVDYLMSERVSVDAVSVDPTHVPSRKFLAAIFGTNWCGRGHTGENATGALDKACHAHDKRYDAAKASGVGDALTNRSAPIVAADFLLVGGSFASMGESTWRGGVVGTTFAVIGGYKLATHLGTPSTLRNQWY